MIFTQYTNKRVEEVLNILHTSFSGISKEQALSYQKACGFNEVKIKNINALEILLRQLKSPFTYLLFIAALVSIIIGHFVDSIAVLFFIFINVTIGFFQEYKAEKSIILLQKFIAQKVKVIRRPNDSLLHPKEEIIEKKFLVPGDVVLLEAGDLVPADLRVVSVLNFLVDESVLTGESVPVSKVTDAMAKPASAESFGEARNIIFSGTSVVSGKATAVVISVGKDTVFGNIIKTTSGVKRESAYEKSIMYFSKLILKIVATTIILIFITNLFLKGINNIWELLLFSVALIVSILPEALPAVITFALSKGSLEMAKQKVVVKRLSAIEDLGNIEILCTDKTGTLTLNKMSLEETVSTNREKCFLYGILASGASNIESKILNPFDAALYQKAPKEVLQEAKKFKIISELPFDSYRMRSAFLISGPLGRVKNSQFLIVRGAPELIIKNCSSMGGRLDKKKVKEDIIREGLEGKRVLAIAFKKIAKERKNIKVQDERGLTFLGYFVFDDPVKDTAKEAVALSKKLGVKIKIITGDSKEVAGFVARQTGLVAELEDVISGEELYKLSKEEFDDACEEKTVFARISPDLKHDIIKSLQKKYEVGFMGEGINDALALKTSDVGIVVVEASDMARSAADVVLLEKDLRVIVSGIKDGRGIFANINKYIKTALANNFGQFYSLAVISLFINFLPMLPVQILLSNILSDLPLIFIATDSVDIEELRKPRMYQLHNVLPLIVSLALVGTLFDFIFFTIFYNSQPGVIQTLWFMLGLLTDIFLIFVVRTRHPFWKAKRPSKFLIISTILAGIIIITLPFLKIGQELFSFVTPPLVPLLIVILLSLIYFACVELVKLIYFHYWRPVKNVVK